MTAKNTIMKNPLAFAVSVATAAMISVNASAQLEEVIVTAQKRAESVQDVPIAITAFDSEALTARQITGFADMRFAAPNVTYTKANFTGNNFQIRGVGTNLVAASADSGVGVHVNEVPIVSPRLFETEYFDVEQVAVLRGPQGTLYGRNSTGGAVNMITQPAHSDALEGNIEGQYGDYDHTKFNGHINIPLGKQFAVRFAGLYLDRDGYTDNKFTGNDVDGRDQYALRGSLNWTPGDNTSIDLMVSYFDESSTRSRSQKTMCHNDPSGLLGCLPDSLKFDQPNPSSTLGYILASDAVLGALAIWEFGTNDTTGSPRDFRTVNSERDPDYDADETLVTLHINHDLDNYTLALVAGYQDTSVDSQMDYTWSVGPEVEVPALVSLLAPQTYAAFYSDGTLPISAPSKHSTGSIGGHIDSSSSRITAYDQSNMNSEQYSAEARIQSDYEGPLNFLLGGFYMDVDIDNQYWVFQTGLDYFSAVAAAALVGADGAGWVAPMFNNSTDDYSIESTAIFGEVYYDFTETVKLTLGARYTIDQKEIKDRQYLANRDATTGAPLIQALNADLPIPVPQRDTDKEWKEWTGRAVLDWAINNDSMAYISYSRGYKGGGFNPPFDTIEFPDTATEFDPEFVDAYEIGIKNTLFDSTLQANFTAFYYDYQDMQISKIFNRTSFNENTDAEIYGVEVELVFAPDEHWLLNANMAYLHTEATDFSSIDSRDPTDGRNDVTLIKDITNAANCVALIDPETFAAIAGSQFSSCSALADAGLPMTEGIFVDLDGNQLQNSPEWSVSLGGQYTFFLPRDHRLSMRVDYYWQDEMYARLFNREVDKIDDWHIWNAQATLMSADDSWYVRAFIKNIEDDDNMVGQYLTGASSGLFTNVFTIEPRTYGMAVGYNFN
jgi:outer membrane receptor protein involved in Fe transport